MYIAIDRNNVIRAVSANPFRVAGKEVRTVANNPRTDWQSLVGKRVADRDGPAPAKSIRVAMICNWGQQCGIATYSGYLAEALRPLVGELRIFSEHGGPEQDGVEYCWRRGEPMGDCVRRVREWGPDFVLVQHEFGLFPNAFHYLQLIQGLDDLPYAVVMHSVYDHLDKAVCTAATRNIVVHSGKGRDTLAARKVAGDIDVLPHGCIRYPDAAELWNIFRSPYTIVQFGFGFAYKGMDRAIEAVSHLKQSDPKFRDIQYLCLVSTNENNRTINNDYYNMLVAKASELGVQDNVAIIRRFFSEEAITYYLRTAKLAIFPYLVSPGNAVFGASGAVRVAMANGIPTICSESHLFDDLEGILPRPASHLELAREIDRVFSDADHRQGILSRSADYVAANSWAVVAQKYLDLYPGIWAKLNRDTVRL